MLKPDAILKTPLVIVLMIISIASTARAQSLPDITINKPDAFPNSVVGLRIDAAVFIGFTERASYNGKELWNQSVKIDSLDDFKEIFGNRHAPKYVLMQTTDPANCDISFDGNFYRLELAQGDEKFYLYDGVRLFFENGGKTCYIVAVDSFDRSVKSSATDMDRFARGIAAIENLSGPFMVAIPDGVKLGAEEYFNRLCDTLLYQCGRLQDRVAILDVPQAFTPEVASKSIDILSRTSFPSAPQTSGLNYGAVFYPWIASDSPGVEEIDSTFFQDPRLIESITHGDTEAILNLRKLIAADLKLIPPSCAIAGRYADNDEVRGTWTSIANSSLHGVSASAFRIDDSTRTNLSTPLDGRAVNCIINIPSRGAVISSDLTLNASSPDWRQMSSRRELIMIEQSIKAAMHSYVFSPNNANTWTAVRSMISSYLTSLWVEGGLKGATAADAFSVTVGLGTSMTPTDLLDGYMVLTVQLAPLHPAEFIVLTFRQQMAVSN